MARSSILLLTLLSLLLTSQWTLAKAEECYADWGVAAEIVRSRKLMTVGELAKGAAASLPGQIVKTTLCKDGDDYIYKLVVRDGKGQLKTVVLDAAKAIAGGDK